MVTNVLLIGASISATTLLPPSDKLSIHESCCGKRAGRWKQVSIGLIALIWLCAAVAGLGLLAAYSSVPGKVSQAPIHWPADSSISPADNMATLLMFAHPLCPCTRASLGELEKIAARCQGKVAIKVVIFSPTTLDKKWSQSDLWDLAAAIPGVAVLADTDGVEARRFRASVSGQALMFDKQGDLVFEGGITSARGHAGDNAGSDVIESYLLHDLKPSSQTPVFGCPLVSSQKTSL